MKRSGVRERTPTTVSEGVIPFDFAQGKLSLRSE